MPDTMSHAPAAVTLLGPSDGEMLNVLGAPMLVKTDARCAPIFLADHTVPPGYGVPPHTHDVEDEAFYMLEGEIVVESPAGTVTARAGDTALLPRGVQHSFRNESGAPARFLVICVDGTRAAPMFRALDRLAEPTPQTVMATCAAHGVRFG